MMIHTRVCERNGAPMSNDARENAEILWQLHSIGQKLDKNYKLNHFTVTDRSTICERYVIEFNHRNKNNGIDSSQ